jgi:mRNA-degrading endonuclease HigB of HigAB toxin-antitoxin module
MNINIVYQGLGNFNVTKKLHMHFPIAMHVFKAWQLTIDWWIDSMIWASMNEIIMNKHCDSFTIENISWMHDICGNKLRIFSHTNMTHYMYMNMNEWITKAQNTQQNKPIYHQLNIFNATNLKSSTWKTN